MLRRNLALNSAGVVQVVHAAIAYGAASALFEQVKDPASGGLSTSGSRPGVSVPTTTVEAILGDKPGPFALVCDIEGSEFELFRHESEAVRRRCQLAVMELHEITRDGVRYDRPSLANHLAHLWGMKIVFEDGKVWVFGR